MGIFNFIKTKFKGESSQKPDLVAINHDDYHAKHIGKLKSGNLFFLTTPFEPQIESEGCEYIALFLFDPSGSLINSKIEKLGPRAELDEKDASIKYDKMLQNLGEVEFSRIDIRPFSVEKYGIEFGLILREPEDEEDVWAVELLPGNYMAFFEPWDDGDYDT